MTAARPSDSETLFGTAAVLRRQGKIKEALTTYRQASELDPRNPVLLLNLGETYALVRDLPEASRFLDRAIALTPDWPGAYGFRVRHLLRIGGQIERARETASRAAALALPEDHELAYLVGPVRPVQPQLSGGSGQALCGTARRIRVSVLVRAEGVAAGAVLRSPGPTPGRAEPLRVGCPVSHNQAAQCSRRSEIPRFAGDRVRGPGQKGRGDSRSDAVGDADASNERCVSRRVPRRGSGPHLRDGRRARFGRRPTRVLDVHPRRSRHSGACAPTRPGIPSEATRAFSA